MVYQKRTGFVSKTNKSASIKYNFSVVNQPLTYPAFSLRSFAVNPASYIY
jgi:hypothetical protein